MGDAGAGEARVLQQVAVTRKWLEDPRVGYDGSIGTRAAGGSQELSHVALAGARVSVAEPGRVVCSLRVRAPVADAEGRWHAGAIATAVDCVTSAVVYAAVGAPTATVDFSMSYFSPADRDTEVEVDGRVVSRKGKLMAVAVEVRKKESGELVAVGRQWVTPAWPTKANKTSKL